MDKYLWNPAAGLYMDYDFVDETRSSYRYLTTFLSVVGWCGQRHAGGDCGAASVGLRARRRTGDVDE